MATRIQGNKPAIGLERFAVVVSRFNEMVTSRLAAGAMNALKHCGGRDENIVEVSVPGAWELPVAAKGLAESGQFDAVICVGCVIRGETAHHEHIARAVARGLGQIALEHSIPVTLGVLTTDTVEQAMERSGGQRGNKGADAAMAAVEMVSVMGQIRGLGRKK